MPKVLSIDECKGNAETGKYQCILVDARKKYVLEIWAFERVKKRLQKPCLFPYINTINIVGACFLKDIINKCQ